VEHRARSAFGIHLNLDNAWPDDLHGLPTIDAREWGPRLRFSAPARVIEHFVQRFAAELPRFVLYGSGDFHYLSALWLRRITEPFVLVSFDNHPDWDWRPPRWGCGGWINRALELPLLRKVSVWGCGNFECWWPGQIFGNRAAERAGRIDLHIWGDQRPAGRRKRRGVMYRENWRAEFEQWAAKLAGENVYITIDLDCLTSAAAVTNWENGLFEVTDLEWALTQIRGEARVVGGDLCGAYSKPKYARAAQRFIAEFDHPKPPATAAADAHATNLRTFARLWPLLAD